MTKEKIPFEHVKLLADQYEIRSTGGENEASLRYKVAQKIIEETGDSLHAMEIISGKDYHDFDEGETGLSMLLHMTTCNERDLKFKQAKDTHLRMGWEEYEFILDQNKFERVMAYDFRDTFDRKRKEEFGIWVRPDKGFLLTAESYGGKKDVNSTKLYYELSWRINGEEFGELESSMVWDVLSGTGNGPCNVGKDHVARDVSRDAREGLITYIRNLEESPFQTNVPWKFFDKHFLWLCDYSETKKKKFFGKSYDYETIARKKISKLPKYAQEMLGVKA
jgi:hypothetical protein